MELKSILLIVYCSKHSYPFHTNTGIRRGTVITFQGVAGCTVVFFLLVPQMFFICVTYYLVKFTDDSKAIIANLEPDDPTKVAQSMRELVLLHQRLLRFDCHFVKKNCVKILKFCQLLDVHEIVCATISAKS